MNVPVIDVGGTHVTAAFADTARWRIVEQTRQRIPLRSSGTADEIIATLAAAIRSLGDISSLTLGVAMPGPFDYATGIGRFRDVGKFDALNCVDIGSAIQAALSAPPERIAFVNDASAFTIGEWINGAAHGARRVVGITLGTGVGSAFLDHGQVIKEGPDVPPHGYAHLLRVNGRPLEDLISRRAIIAAYESARADCPAKAELEPNTDVEAIARLAANGDDTSQSVIDQALGALGEALRPWLVRFGAEILVVGGGIAASWEVVGPVLRRALLCKGTPAALAWRGGAVAQARDPEGSTLVGVAWNAIGLPGQAAHASLR